MKLNLGAGSRPKSGFVNLDKKAYKGIQVVHNLDIFPWPLEAESFDEIRAIDVFEHLIYFTEAMDECWRILMPGGLLIIQGPLAGSRNHYLDPTHRRGFLSNSLDMFDPSTQRGQHYAYGEGNWKILQKQEIVAGKTVQFKLRKEPG